MPTRRRSADTPFSGFTNVHEGAVPVPGRFFTDLLPEITSLPELQVTLAMLRLFAEHGGYEAPVAEPQVLADRALRTAFTPEGTTGGDARQAILDALDRAVARGTLLRVQARSGRRATAWYFLHTVVTRELVRAIQRGAISPPPAMWTEDRAPEVTADPPTPFFLYEQNIGPLTPMVADRITRAMDEYPASWLEDAIEEAVTYNRRSWRYIERILQSWAEQGRAERSS